MNADHPQRYCTHATCRDDTAAELLWMGKRLWRRDLIAMAGEAYRATVRCRHVPRKGPIHAPLPQRKS